MKEYIITLSWDTEAGVWYAANDEIPIVLESESFDSLVERVRIAAPELLEANGADPKCILHFMAERKDWVA
jgi:hypothetical protein